MYIIIILHQILIYVFKRLNHGDVILYFTDELYKKLIYQME